MISCPHCGAENPDGSAFCSLCLARLDRAGQSARPADHSGESADYHDAGIQARQEYVAPGDYRALAQEMSRQPHTTGGAQAYRQAHDTHPGAAYAARLPVTKPSRSVSDIVIMLLLYSFAAFWALFFLRMLLSIFLLGAAFGGSEAGFSIGIAMIFISDAAVLAVSGYFISAKAMHRGRGWAYGAGCAACVVFFWQPIASIVMALVFTGEVYLPIFTLAGILFTLFLELPMGALGGWFAEKRLVG